MEIQGSTVEIYKLRWSHMAMILDHLANIRLERKYDMLYDRYVHKAKSSREKIRET